MDACRYMIVVFPFILLVLIYSSPFFLPWNCNADADFEKCATVQRVASTCVCYIQLILWIWVLVGGYFHVPIFYKSIWSSIQRLRSRLRTSSTRTCDVEQELPDKDEPEIAVKANLFHRTHDTSLQQSSLKQILDATRSVGLLFNKNGALGSVVRVGSKYVITAWHVVELIVCQRINNFNNQPMNLFLLAAPDVYIDFNEYCRQSPKRTHFKVCPKIVFVDCQWDIVILEISGEGEFLPEPVRRFADISYLSTTKFDVTCVHVIGLHPKKEIVVADISCKIIYPNDERVKKALKWTKKHSPKLKQDLVTRKENPNMVSTAYFDVRDTMHRLIFDTHLQKGGSGGAVLAFTPECDLALVAILTHGLPSFRPNCSSEIPESITMEVGTTVNAINNSQEWKQGMEKIKEDIFQMQPAMETDGQIEEMDTDARL